MYVCINICICNKNRIIHSYYLLTLYIENVLFFLKWHQRVHFDVEERAWDTGHRSASTQAEGAGAETTLSCHINYQSPLSRK